MPTYSNSPLVSYTCISPNKNWYRADGYWNPSGVIDKITIHHMAGNLSIESCGNIFANPNRGGSSNYGIGSDGRIGLYVDEAHRAWTSSSAANDFRAVTIEVANDGGADTNWHVSSKAMNALIDLCVDICLRNNIEKLNFTGDASGNLTMHQYFAATACPGPYLKSQFSYIAKTVNERLEEARPLTTNDWNKIMAELATRDNKIKSLESQLATAKTANESLAAKLSAAEKSLESKISSNTSKITSTKTQLEETITKKTALSVYSVDRDDQITGAMGGTEAVNMLNDLYETGDFRGGGKNKYSLSAQMVRMMLIFYRMIKRLVKINNLKWVD